MHARWLQSVELSLWNEPRWPRGCVQIVPGDGLVRSYWSLKAARMFSIVGAYCSGHAPSCTPETSR